MKSHTSLSSFRFSCERTIKENTIKDLFNISFVTCKAEYYNDARICMFIISLVVLKLNCFISAEK